MKRPHKIDIYKIPSSAQIPGLLDNNSSGIFFVSVSRYIKNT